MNMFGTVFGSLTGLIGIIIMGKRRMSNNIKNLEKKISKAPVLFLVPRLFNL